MLTESSMITTPVALIFSLWKTGLCVYATYECTNVHIHIHIHNCLFCITENALGNGRSVQE